MNEVILLDYNGQPMNPVVKVDGKHPVTQEIASAATDVYMFQGWLPVMENLDKVLMEEGHGDITMYDDIGRDPRVAASLRTRAKAVTGREWQVVPFSQETADIRVAEYVDKVFRNFPYDRARRPVLRGGVLKGFSVAEIMWDYSEGDTFITDMRYRHQRRFRFAPNGDLHLLTLSNPYPGENATIDSDSGLPLRKFQVFTFGDEVTTPYGNGLGQELFWPWWFKKNGIKYWMTFAEKFSSPTVVGEYPEGTDQAKQQTLLSAAASVHSNSAVVYPAGMSVKLLEAMRSGSVSCYQELCNFMNDEMTIAILGQTATTSGTPGGLGNTDEQQEVLENYLKDDGDSVCEAQNDRQNGVIPWLVDYQFPGNGRYPKMEIKSEDEEDSLTLAERDYNLAQALNLGGKSLSRSYYVRTYGMVDEDIEDTTKPAKPAPALPLAKVPDTTPTPKEQLEFAEGDDAAFIDQDMLDKFVAGITTPAELQKLMEGVLKPLFKLVEEGGDLQGLSDALPKLFPEMDTSRLEGILTRVFFVAAVWGHLSAEEE